MNRVNHFEGKIERERKKEAEKRKSPKKNCFDIGNSYTAVSRYH